MNEFTVNEQLMFIAGALSYLICIQITVWITESVYNKQFKEFGNALIEDIQKFDLRKGK